MIYRRRRVVSTEPGLHGPAGGLGVNEFEAKRPRAFLRVCPDIAWVAYVDA